MRCPGAAGHGQSWKPWKHDAKTCTLSGALPGLAAETAEHRRTSSTASCPQPETLLTGYTFRCSGAAALNPLVKGGADIFH